MWFSYHAGQEMYACGADFNANKSQYQFIVFVSFRKKNLTLVSTDGI